MSYQSLEKKRQPFRWPAILLVIAVVVLGVFNYRPIYNLGTRLATLVAGPFWHFNLSVEDKLNSANQDSLDELNRLRALAVDYERLAADNKRWREIFGSFGEGTTDLPAVARVLTRESQSPTGLIIVDIGRTNSAKAISLGNLVVASGGVAIGSITEVLDRVSKVELYSAPGKHLEAVVGAEHLPVDIVGLGGGNYRFELPRDLSVEVGDIISMIWGGREHSLGVVGVVNRELPSSIQEVFFRLPINLETLNSVEIYVR